MKTDISSSAADLPVRAVPNEVRGDVNNAAEHTKKAFERFRDWLQLTTYVQKQKMQKTGVQLGVSAVFGLFLLAWAEIFGYLAFASIVKPYWAALIVFGINLGIVGGVNAFVLGWKRRVNHLEDRAHQKKLHEAEDIKPIYDGLTAGDAALRAAKYRHEGQLELLLAKDQLVQAKDHLISAKNEIVVSAQNFVQNKIVSPTNRFVVEPVSRNKVPIAFGASFVVGLLTARALIPKRTSVEVGRVRRGQVIDVDLNTLV